MAGFGGGGGLGQGLLQLLELCRCRQYVGHLVALLVTVIAPLYVSPNGDDPTWSRYPQNQVGIIRDRHELAKCWPCQESIVHSLKIGHLKLYGFSLELLLSPEGYGKRDLTDGCRYCTWDYTMERSSTGALKRSGQHHLVESLQKKDVEGAGSIDEYSVELNVLNDRAD
jgi:hypothetical protein